MTNKGFESENDDDDNDDGDDEIEGAHGGALENGCKFLYARSCVFPSSWMDLQTAVVFLQ